MDSTLTEIEVLKTVPLCPFASLLLSNYNIDLACFEREKE